MKSLITVAALAVAASTLVATPAEADSPGCVTRAEYRQVHRGDTRDRVTRVFDTFGHREVHASSGGYQTEVRTYNACSQFSVVSIAFDKNGRRPWKLSAKSAVWVG